MSPDLTENLYAAFPNLYGIGRTRMQDVDMRWGFECGDGWYQILFDLSQALNGYKALHPENNFRVVQVKAKFGQLRFYLDNPPDATMSKMIADASTCAGRTCEITGKAGVLCINGRRRAMVLCEEKASELGFKPLQPKTGAVKTFYRGS